MSETLHYEPHSKNAGRELRQQGDPEQVRVHDFKLPELGKVAPYGVYDIAANHGWVSVGIDADTGAFAVESIRRWWQKLGKSRYPDATRLVITADCGGSNGPQLKLWKRELQRFTNETGLKVTVAHLPPGTSKWNKIEHRLFAFITVNWRGKPLVSHQVIVQLIGATTTETGLKVCCEIDSNLYPKGVNVTDQEMQAIRIARDDFHGEWNYTISPNQQPP
jgi:Rhodopirellula transposase DDE domain